MTISYLGSFSLARDTASETVILTVLHTYKLHQTTVGPPPITSAGEYKCTTHKVYRQMLSQSFYYRWFPRSEKKVQSDVNINELKIVRKKNTEITEKTGENPEFRVKPEKWHPCMLLHEIIIISYFHTSVYAMSPF